MPALTLPLICICAGLPQPYRACEGDLGHHTHHSTPCTQRPTGGLSEDDAYGGSGPWRALPRSVQAGVAEIRP